MEDKWFLGLSYKIFKISVGSDILIVENHKNLKPIKVIHMENLLRSMFFLPFDSENAISQEATDYLIMPFVCANER